MKLVFFINIKHCIYNIRHGTFIKMLKKTLNIILVFELSNIFFINYSNILDLIY